MLTKEIVSYDEDSKEADVLLTTNGKVLLVYAPKFSRNCTELVAFLPTNICVTRETPNIIKTETSYYSHKIIGILKYKNKDYGKVEIDDIIIEVENIPGDINVNDTLSFDCVRVDYIQDNEKIL